MQEKEEQKDKKIIKSSIFDSNELLIDETYDII